MATQEKVGSLGKGFHIQFFSMVLLGFFSMTKQPKDCPPKVQGSSSADPSSLLQDSTPPSFHSVPKAGSNYHITYHSFSVQSA